MWVIILNQLSDINTHTSATHEQVGPNEVISRVIVNAEML